MKISPLWLREFVDLPVDSTQLAEDLTLAGIAVESVSGNGDDAVFDMEITTNRPDAMNHYGIARECSALYGVTLKPITAQLPEDSGNVPDFKIAIEDREGCARYTARIIHGVKVKASPDSISKRLANVDQRPINAAADASNYTLWEMGHPTHAFDLDLLVGGQITVRRAHEGETLKTLDGIDRKLSSEDLVIADAKKPVALAGVIGGFETMITAKTKTILIESAWFDPVAIRNSSKRHGLHTDASHRFERGADYGATPLACSRVAQRILESAGGSLHGNEIDVIARPLDQAPISLRMSEVRRILGNGIETTEVLRILRALGFDIIPEPGEEAEFTVQIPSWRLDVEREVDLIEEIARLHGYDKFPNTLPPFPGAVIETPSAKKDHKLRTTLLALGYNEAISPTFISEDDATRFSPAEKIKLANPLSEEASVMRTSLVPGMLRMLGYNLNRGADNVRLFEAGNVFAASPANPSEIKSLCLGAVGNSVPAGVHQAATQFSFFDLKGDVETLLRTFDLDGLEFEEDAAAYYRSGFSARLSIPGTMIAQFGQISYAILAQEKIRRDVFIAEIYVDKLYIHDLRQPKYAPLSRFPGVERDFSFVFDDAIIFGNIQQAIYAIRIGELQSFTSVEIFRGGSVPANKYSLLLRAKFQSGERTLKEEEVARWADEIVTVLKSLGGKQRT